METLARRQRCECRASSRQTCGLLFEPRSDPRRSSSNVRAMLSPGVGPNSASAAKGSREAALAWSISWPCGRKKPQGWGTRHSCLQDRGLVEFGDQQAQVAQVLAGGPVTTVAQRGEHGTGVEGGQRCLQMKSEGMGAGHGGGVGDGAGRLVFPSMPSEPALSTVRRSPGYCSSSSAQAMANCWLRPPAPGVRSRSP
jgi:hypothetical protein